uniref:Uncharacterized protein n=1 Tax=Timema tahoe TaxID=61484 RepID=A0A7R9IGA0_9NEOP|nr:unnamed protein product [Timema tahoe]
MPKFDVFTSMLRVIRDTVGTGGHHYIACPLHRMTITSRFGNKYIAGPSHRISPTSLHTANPTLTYNQ